MARRWESGRAAGDVLHAIAGWTDTDCRSFIVWLYRRGFIDLATLRDFVRGYRLGS